MNQATKRLIKFLHNKETLPKSQFLADLQPFIYKFILKEKTCTYIIRRNIYILKAFLHLQPLSLLVYTLGGGFLFSGIKRKNLHEGIWMDTKEKEMRYFRRYTLYKY